MYHTVLVIYHTLLFMYHTVIMIYPTVSQNLLHCFTLFCSCIILFYWYITLFHRMYHTALFMYHTVTPMYHTVSLFKQLFRLVIWKRKDNRHYFINDTTLPQNIKNHIQNMLRKFCSFVKHCSCWTTGRLRESRHVILSDDSVTGRLSESRHVIWCGDSVTRRLSVVMSFDVTTQWQDDSVKVVVTTRWHDDSQKVNMSVDLTTRTESHHIRQNHLYRERKKQTFTITWEINSAQSQSCFQERSCFKFIIPLH